MNCSTYQAELSRIDEVWRAEAHQPSEKVSNGSGTTDCPGSQPRAHNFRGHCIRSHSHTAVVKEFEQGDECGEDVGTKCQVIAGTGSNGRGKLTETAAHRSDHENVSPTEQMSHREHSNIDPDESNAARHNCILESLRHSTLKQEICLICNQEPYSRGALAANHAIA